MSYPLGAILESVFLFRVLVDRNLPVVSHAQGGIAPGGLGVSERHASDEMCVLVVSQILGSPSTQAGIRKLVI